MASDGAITSDSVPYYFDNLLPDGRGLRDRAPSRFNGGATVIGDYDDGSLLERLVL